MEVCLKRVTESFEKFGTDVEFNLEEHSSLRSVVKSAQMEFRAQD